MKQTTKVLLSAVLTIALCLSVISGATFALFTSEASTNIAVNAGKVNVTATIHSVTLSSLGVRQTDTFANGGTAVYANGTLTLDKVTPGDKAEFSIVVTNNSNVDIKYCVVMNATGELAPAIKTTATIDSQEYEITTANSATAWFDVEANEPIADIPVTVELPAEVGNEYQEKSAKVTITLMAVQSNGSDLHPWTGYIPTNIPTSLVIENGTNGDKTGTITVKSPEALVYLSTLAKNWVSTFSGGGTDVTSYRESNGGKGTDYYYHWEWTVELAADLDMSNIPMDSIDISYWGAFDGNGHTISNVVLKDGQDGLFNNGVKTIDNLTVKNITVNAPAAQTVGAVAGNGNMTNVHVENATVVGGKYVGGICGKGSSFEGCSIKDSTVTGNDKTVGGLVGYSIGDPNPATVTGNTVENVTVTGAYNVGGLLGQAQNETVENNTVKNVTVKSTIELPADASANEVRAVAVAARSVFDNTTIGANTTEAVTIVEVKNVSSGTNLSTVLPNNQSSEVVLEDGNYTLPGVSNGDVTINGTKDTVITVTTPAFHGTDVTFNGVTIKGSGYNTGVQHVDTVTYNNCVVNGTMLLYGNKVVFNNCTFNLSGDYLWTYGAAEVEFNGCTFNTTGKALLLYKDGGVISQTVTVKGCTFNASAGAKAGAIANQNCAAIELHNYMSSINLITEDNTYDANFSGEWRIKQYDTAYNCTISVNGVEYTQIAIDGKLMTIDANKQVTVLD